MRKILSLALLFCLLIVVVSCKPEESHHNHIHVPELEKFNMRCYGNELFYTDREYSSGLFKERDLYLYDLHNKGDEETILIENIRVFEVTDDYIFYVKHSGDGEFEKQHQATDNGENIRKFSVVTKIYRYDRKSSTSILFASISNLRNFYVHDNWLYAISGDIYDIDSKTVIGNTKVCEEYRIERFDINDTEIIETIFSEYYIDNKYADFADGTLNHAVILSSFEYFEWDKEWISNRSYDPWNKLPINKIVNDTVYFIYPYSREDSEGNKHMTIASVDLLTKEKKESLTVQADRIYGFDITEDRIKILYASSKYNSKEVNNRTFYQAEYDLQGQNMNMCRVYVPNKAARDDAYDANGYVLYNSDGDLWYFDYDKKLHIVSECVDNIIHENYDFGIHPKIVYATEDFIVFEDFSGKDKTIRMEAVYKDGSSLRIPVEFKGFPGEVVE
ncbi:MAG: hypothetical protein E7385_05950 [Ruminococcaceae bacterium]|nr:hypothetical protein [Oscillospiraceae bacterium]